MKSVLMIGIATGCGLTLLAQTPPAPPASTTTTATAKLPDGGVPKYLKAETPEQRKTRLGTAEDPGLDPNPSTHFFRFGSSFHIEKFDRRWASYDNVDPGSVRPFAYVNAENEVYQQNDKYVWVWVRDVSPEEIPVPANSRYSQEQLRYFEDMRSEFFEVTPKSSDKTIRFTAASDGLPTSGSWRNSLAVADMNGDGCPDIITPPERKGGGTPAIFLGDCKGHWKFWQEATWPRGLDYGNVVAADFNKDGHMDLAFGVHLRGVYAFLGDGKGHFKDASRGLPQRFATRRVAVADVDHDGYPDIVTISEGVPVGLDPNAARGRLRVYFNRDHGTSWEEKDVADNNVQVGGDWLTVANLTGKKSPDIIGSSIFANSNQILFLSDGPGKWRLLADRGYVVPYLSYYSANAAGKFSSKKVEDAIISYTRYWPTDLNSTANPDPPEKKIVGIDRISFAGGEPKRTPVVRWGGNRAIGGVAVGDFDGDGNVDLIYTRHDPREAVILLGDGKGGFARARIEGLTLKANTNYDVTVADVNNDGKPDVVVMYESAAATVLAVQDGAVEVFLNRGVVPATVEANH